MGDTAWHQGDPHLSVLHLFSNVFIFGGFILLAAAWKVLYTAQVTHTLAATGAYARIRHPQYVGFILIMLGFLLQWPTLITLVLFPILVTMDVRLARREEHAASAEFGDAYAIYAAATPAFLPRLNARNPADRADNNPAQSIDTPRERKRPI